MSSPSSAAPPGPGPQVGRAVGLLAAEAVLLAALGLLDVIAALRAPAVGTGGAPVATEHVDRAAALGFAGSVVLAGLIVALLAAALHRRRGWARTPALVVQLVAFPVGADQVLGAVWLTGPLILLLAGATTYHLLAAGSALRSGSPQA